MNGLISLLLQFHDLFILVLAQTEQKLLADLLNELVGILFHELLEELPLQAGVGFDDGFALFEEVVLTFLTDFELLIALLFFNVRVDRLEFAVPLCLELVECVRKLDAVQLLCRVYLALLAVQVGLHAANDSGNFGALNDIA